MFDGSAEPRFAGDDGSADPSVTAALAAFAAGGGSEQDVLAALAAGRLLVPVVAALTPDQDTAAAPERAAGPVSGPADSGPDAFHPAGGGEKASEMALPTLVGQDGRRAIPVFTGVAALARWQPAARPIPAPAAQVWQAAMQDGCAVVIDIAGPVPLAVEGDRLAALAAGQSVPPPHQDTDVRDAVARAVVESAVAAGVSPGTVGFALRAGTDGADLVIELALPAGLDPDAAGRLAAQAGSAAMTRLGGRLRRGIAVALAASPARNDSAPGAG
ncbi:MAG TPA: SseB family protein [Streptosporangiaceae bacterium]